MSEPTEHRCVWCKAGLSRSAKRRSLRSHSAAPALCTKCSLWALTGHAPPYVKIDHDLSPPPVMRSPTGAVSPPVV